ncbi:MAG: putative trifunctional 2-polyprenylphenol hydroxylase/glutamate synthase subunit beta/ferritin domain-containing protein [bacterium ADurb.Bin478]|nr:MAG: putative trifunctional 2-polyprenylphenol hydroxylase/glutamate synthase subunit beta/ferritin domain-containing protein [bacterium ADurb.Bin478]
MDPTPLSQAQAVALAVNLEINGRAFYLQAAEKAVHPTGKALFLKLAEEEKVHLAAFQAMLKREFDGWPESDQLCETRAKPVPPLFDEKAAASFRRATADEMSALRIALKQENEAITFFEKAIALAEDDHARRIFTFVKDQENFHYALLQAELDYIAGTGFWFDSPEFRMDGKA